MENNQLYGQGVHTQLAETINMTVNENSLDGVFTAGLNFACPLDVPCSYSRDQALVALDFLSPATVREGVKYLRRSIWTSFLSR